MTLPLPPPPVVSGGTRVFVLWCVCEGVGSARQIARESGKDKSTIKYHLEKLERDGLVELVAHSWKITEQGRAEVLALKAGDFRREISLPPPSPVSDGSDGTPNRAYFQQNPRVGEKTPPAVRTGGSAVGKNVRLHRVWLNLGIVDRRDDFGSRVQYKNGVWCSTRRLGDGTLQLWSNGRLMAKLPVFWGSSPEECEFLMKRWVVEWARMVRDVVGCPLADTWVVSQGEVAWVGHAMAKKCEARKLKIHVRDQDGKLWLTVDKSLGEPELEAVHSTLHMDDAKMLEDFFNQLRAGRWKEVQSGLAQVGGVVMENVKLTQVILQKVQKLESFGGNQ